MQRTKVSDISDQWRLGHHQRSAGRYCHLEAVKVQLIRLTVSCRMSMFNFSHREDIHWQVLSTQCRSWTADTAPSAVAFLEKFSVVNIRVQTEVCISTTAMTSAVKSMKRRGLRTNPYTVPHFTAWNKSGALYPNCPQYQ